MSERDRAALSVTTLVFDFGAEAATPITLRVKPDRRRRQIPFTGMPERRGVQTISAARVSGANDT